MSTELVKHETETLPAPIVPLDIFKGRKQLQSFFDQDSAEKVAQLGRAINVDAPNFPKDPEVIDCVGVTVWTRRVSESKAEEVEYGLYLALHCKDGRNFVGSAACLVDCMPDLAASYGMPPWPKGVQVTIGRKPDTPQKRGRLYAAAGDLSLLPNTDEAAS